MKKLILITSHFPCAQSEFFLESELLYYGIFDKVVVYPIAPYSAEALVKLPDNIEYELPSNESRTKPSKWIMITSLFNGLFLQELFYSIRKGFFSKGNTYLLLQQLSRARLLSSYLYKTLLKYVSPKDDIYIYIVIGWKSTH